MSQRLKLAIVRIYHKGQVIVSGAGFLVSEKHVLTCAHVVNAALNQPMTASEQPAGTVSLDFPQVAPGEKLTARVVGWIPASLPNAAAPADGGTDIAVLELESPLPASASPVRLVTGASLQGHQFRVLGFPEGQPAGVWTDGIIQGEQANGRVQIEVVRQTTYKIEPGFSGSPVWDAQLDGVVGMTVAIDSMTVASGTNPAKRPEVRAAFIIPTGLLAKAWPQLSQLAIPPCPYRGLFAFREEDAQFFFGRETFASQLVEAVRTKPLVAVIGPSGSGKSSVVFAGLIPQLRSQNTWLIEDFRPGDRPFRHLAAKLVPLLEPQMSETDRLGEVKKLAVSLQRGDLALQDVVTRILEKNAGTRLLLVADQFEELYTLCKEESERQRFLNRLLEALNGEANFRLALTLRADFLGYALSYRPFADALQNADVKLGPMNRQELRDAIEQPAQLLGVRIEEGLTERILDDVQESPGNLPLLEFALTQLWEKQRDGKLIHDAYEEIGGVEKALAGYAEEEYGKLSEADKQRAQRVFIQLVRPGEGTEDTRRTATRAEVGEDNWDLVTRLATSRLVVTARNEGAGEETVEVVHEALIREWGTLRRWVNDNREFRTWQERLKARMREWKDAGADDGALLRGAPLAQAEEWQQKRSGELSKEEREFIEASLALRDREIKQKEQRRQRTVIGLAGFSAVALSLAGFAGWGWLTAEINQLNTVIQSSKAFFASNKEDALTESLKARKLLKQVFWADASTRSEVEGVLAQAVYGVKPPNPLGEGHSDSVTSAVFSPDGKRIASASGDRTVKIWDATTGKLLATLSGHSDSVISAVFSPDGKRIASASWDKTVKIWDAATGKELATLSGHSIFVNSAVFSPDGKRIASASDDNTVKIWDAATGKLLATLSGHSSPVISAVFSPDGKRIASASRDSTVKIWDAATGKLLATLSGHSAYISSAVFSPDGKRIVSASYDKSVKIWDATKGKEIRTLNAHSASVSSAVFSPDGKRIISASWDKTVKIWDATTGKEIRTLNGHSKVVRSAVFSPDGKRIASASDDSTVKIWDAATGKALATLSGHSSDVIGAVFSPDGQHLASASDDKTVKIWDAATGEVIRTLKGHSDSVRSADFSPDGKRIASASWDKTVKIWDAATGKEIRTLQGHSDSVRSADFSPDGQRIASASDDKTVKIWDAATGKALATLSGHSYPVFSAVFSPDGKRIVSASWDNTVKIWDAATGKKIHTLSRHRNIVSRAVFSPDGKRIASAGYDSTVKIWDADTGEEIRTLSGHSSPVYSTDFSPDGKRIASASADKTVKIWDADTGKVLVTLSGHSASVISAVFSPDGQQIASASGDYSVRVWDLDWNLDELTKRGCDWLRKYGKNKRDEDLHRHLCDDIPASL
jgi:WD40 repeat protein